MLWQAWNGWIIGFLERTVILIQLYGAKAGLFEGNLFWYVIYYVSIDYDIYLDCHRST